MTTAATPAPRLTAADLTAADVEALVYFIDRRVDRVLAANSVESDEWRAGLGLRNALNYQAKRARKAFERNDQSLETVLERFRRWNGLAVLALGWARDPGYDDRWRVVYHPSAEGAALWAALRSPITSSS
ncbi:hypothetical protein [Streptomyces sp. NPDC008125]|uniref:hypothetical protein n=1 Tax=Streptomyces sp. NPDC008125 TaxID=3364811 RepID=UPI0036F0A15E